VKSWNGQKWKMHQFAVVSRSRPGVAHTVWGLTARILVDAAVRELDMVGTPTFRISERYSNLLTHD